MDAPLAGYLYYDEDLHDGHYFIVGPDDPIVSENVIIFCCTSKPLSRPNSAGCHANHRLPSFHLAPGTIPKLTLPTWVQLDEVYYYAKSDFDTKWRYAKEKLDLSLTIDLLKCASESTAIAKSDAKACGDEANLLEAVL